MALVNELELPELDYLAPELKGERGLVNPAFTPRAADRWQPVMRDFLGFLSGRIPGLALDGAPVLGSSHGIYGVERLPLRWS